MEEKDITPDLRSMFSGKMIKDMTFDKAIEILEEACRFPTAQFVPFTMLAALHAITGSETEAKKLLARAVNLNRTSR